MLHPHSLYRISVFAFVLAFCMECWAQGPLGPDDDSNFTFWLRTPLPLGADEFHLRPAGRDFYLMSCVEDRRFDHLQVSRVRTAPTVVDSRGEVWKTFPSEVTFRVTATGMDAGDIKADVDTVEEPGDLNSFLLGLRFRLKVFQGLRMTVLNPEAVRSIGVPSDVASDERVFRVSFKTENIPVDARLVMEVLTPEGKTLSRFHLELL